MSKDPDWKERFCRERFCRDCPYNGDKCMIDDEDSGKEK